jgi:AbrB family looped-hinge helix DNA binding protein
MRTTIDMAGRVVIPKALRGEVGLVPGSDVEVTADGAGIRIEPVPGEGLVEEEGFAVIPPSDISLDDDAVRELRRADQR